MTTLMPDLLEGLSPAQAAELMKLGQRLTLAGGQVLFRLGEEADRLFFVERGRIELRLPLNVGGQQREVLLEERSTAQTVGWSGLIPPHRFTLTGLAAVESDVVAFPRAVLQGHFARQPEVGYAVMRNVSAVVSQRLQVMQAMWARAMQQALQARAPEAVRP